MENKKRAKRPQQLAQWNQIECGQRLDEALDITPMNWQNLTRLEARDRILMLLSLQRSMTEPMNFFTS